ncbi:hypothetical protein [uncultured Castellaniella sp.]|uniref:hypothetical protein n=1 Tax=uncultured Castellaniella sp. TaxID=647907 RepID=UPI0026028CD4|nr:hypothetical protein [uncultured Castellaniella sp.]
MPVKGIDRVKANYRRVTREIATKTTDRTVAAILSQGGAMAATMTPIDTSNLINSHFVEIKVERNKIIGRTGYTASYAFAVHEAPGTLKGQPRPDGRGDYWDPNASPRFLSEGFDQIKSSIPAILKAHYRA